ncbi:hypothetical protein [Sinorhizobium meliloti]|uniref:hypothetical protein n=1 Tax=Rhizobium meliloti TaxID=382 RepID=UPI000B4A1E9D|nr:hypothetical protein [Sinorhizobium meliloti]ASP68310.1 hypothetical protein CDO29_28070 [Sinorhizobium meliloti]MQX00657.1 hypothetical protein [Sinorhizobium meliloti]RVK54282.1 hypothetical protein CN160_04605 [Sinorhizobium meliloti]
MGEKTFTLEEALKRVPAEFPRPWLKRHFHETRFYNIIVRELATDVCELAADANCDPIKEGDGLSLALAEQGVFPAWVFDFENGKRKRKIDRRHHVLMPGESLRYIKWLRQMRKQPGDAKAA